SRKGIGRERLRKGAERVHDHRPAAARRRQAEEGPGDEMDSGLIDMTRSLAIAALALGLGGPTAAPAQTPPELTNPDIDFTSRPPTSEQYKPLYQRMKDRQILERLAAFLSPINLKGGLALSLEEGDRSCTSANSYYDRRGTLHLCY